MGIRRPLGLCMVLASLLAGCATTVAPIGSTQQPFTPDPDEQLLWAQADQEAATLLKRGRRYDEPALAVYLAELARRLTPDPVKAAGGPVVLVEVLRDPTLGAFALPNGRVFVTTGVVAAVESEAQLALVLARELAHVYQRHALAVWRDGDIADVGRSGVTPLGPTAAAILGGRLQLVARAAMTGYPARLEHEADDAALASVSGAGWSAVEAAGVWARLAGELRERGALETSPLARPAWLRARSRASRRAPAGGAASSEAFEAVRRLVLGDNAADDGRAGRFALARREVDRVLAASPGNAAAHVLDGDLSRLQSQWAATPSERDAELVRARARYLSALALDPTLAEAHRQLGLLYYQQQDLARARAEFEEYARLAGGAPDAARIAEYARELGR